MFNSTVDKNGNLVLIKTERAVAWRPDIGDVYFKPDMNASTPRVLELDWMDSAPDNRWLELKRVFKTPQEALEEWENQMAIAWYIVNGEEEDVHSTN